MLNGCGVEKCDTQDTVLPRSGMKVSSDPCVIRSETRSDVILREGTCLENGGSS